MTRAVLRDGARLQLFDTGGDGLPVLFQHGLGGSDAQVRSVFPGGGAHRRVTLECRAQGGSESGAARPFTLAMLTDDVLAGADAAGLDRFVAGGISTGAAIALRLAHLHPGRVAGLILVRPSFLFEKAPANMAPFAEIAALLRRHAPDEARRRFEASDWAATLSEEGPDNLQSLLGFFERPDPLVVADLLEGIAGDGTGVSRADAERLQLPTLVIGNALDFVHPPAFAKALAETIPNARLVEVASKARDPAAHRADVGAAIGAFLDGLSTDHRTFSTMKPRSGPDAIAALPRDRLLGEYSLWSADLANLATDIARVDPHVDLYHIDVADGRFAPSFLFFPDQVARIAALTERPLHVHLMVEADLVEAQARQFVEAGADLVSVHAENGAAGIAALAAAREAGAEGGVVLRLETLVENVEPFLPHVAFVTLLGTAIGVKGQALSDEACSRLEALRAILRARGLESAIRVAADGGIRHETVPRLRAAGAQTVVLGSLAFGDPDLGARTRWLHGLQVAA